MGPYEFQIILPILDADILEGLVDGSQLLHTLIQTLLSAGGDKTPRMFHS